MGVELGLGWEVGVTVERRDFVGARTVAGHVTRIRGAGQLKALEPKRAGGA